MAPEGGCHELNYKKKNVPYDSPSNATHTILSYCLSIIIYEKKLKMYKSVHVSV